MNKRKKCLAIILIIAVTLSMVSCNHSADVDIPENTTGAHEHETSEEVTLLESTEGEDTSFVQTESVEETESIETEKQTSVQEEETTVPEESIEDSAESSEEEPTEESTEISTEASTEAPTEVPTEAPTEAPTKEPTKAPTEASTEAPTEHQHVYWEQVIVNGCIQLGYTKYTCACGYSYVSDYVPAKGHNWSDWVTIIAPTETLTGYAEHTCNDCGEKQSKTLSKVVTEHTHNHIVVYTAEATCMAEGRIIYRCACGNEYTEYIAKSDHSYSGTVTVCEPTCTMDGYTEHRCKYCGDIYRDTFVVTSGHPYQVTEETAPTCSSYGTRLETCSKCNEIRETSLPPLECTNLRTEYRKETCGEEGYTKVICNDCNTVISNVTVEPTGQHVFATDDVDDVIDMCAAHYGSDIGLGGYRTYTENEWVVDYCVNCFYADYNAMYLPYTDYEIAEIMLGYVNELRERVFGHSRYNLVIDETLLKVAQIRAKEISKNFSHYEGASNKGAAGENITGGRGIRDHFENWYESEGHYLNMTYEDHQYFAYGIYRTETGLIYGVQLFWQDWNKSVYLNELHHMYYEKFGEFPSSDDPIFWDMDKLWEKIYGEE